MSFITRRIQRWWRQRRQQRLALMDISNFLLPNSKASSSTSSSSSPNKFISADRKFFSNSPEPMNIPAYIVTNTVVSHLPISQNYKIQQIAPLYQQQPQQQQMPQKKPRRPPPSSGIAWFEPKHQRPPAYPPTPRNEKTVTFVENPIPRILSRQSTTVFTPTEPNTVSLRRSNSARSVDNQAFTYTSTPSGPIDSRRLMRSSSINVSVVNRDGNSNGVQRRLRRRTSEIPDLANRRPVSWHVDQMEAQVLAHLEKQKVLNGEIPGVNLRRASSGSRMADDQVNS